MMRVNQARGGPDRDDTGRRGQHRERRVARTEAGEIRPEEPPIGVRVRAPDSVRYNPLRLRALPVVATGTGRVTPLAASRRSRRHNHGSAWNGKTSSK